MDEEQEDVQRFWRQQARLPGALRRPGWWPSPLHPHCPPGVGAKEPGSLVGWSGCCWNTLGVLWREQRGLRRSRALLPEDSASGSGDMPRDSAHRGSQAGPPSPAQGAARGAEAPGFYP